MVAQGSQSPRAPSGQRLRPSAPPVSCRHRNVFAASDLIAAESESGVVLQEHFSKQEVKEARSLFKKMMTRSSAIIEKCRVNCSEAEDASVGDVKMSDDGPAVTIKTEVEATREQSLYSVGQRILCNYFGHGQWCQGTVTRVTECVEPEDSTLYDVRYDDGDEEERRNEAALMPIPRPVSGDDGHHFQTGQLILGNFEEKGIWFEGVISGVFVPEEGDESEVMFDVQYTDGDVEYDIPGACITPAPCSAGAEA